MIPSYQEEIRIRKNKDRIFWFIVAVMTVFLYFFFQGYYPNYERFLDRTDTSKQAFLKPFGIIDIHVFPSPDDILINNEHYNNNSKTIFDLGEYLVSIEKKGYLSVNFLLDINRKNPFYTNVVNLFTLPQYSSLPLAFESLTPVGDLYLLHTARTGSLLLVDTDFRPIQSIQTAYKYIGGLHFTDGENIFTYSQSTETFTSIMNRSTGLPLKCTKISYYGDKLFCHDIMKFVGPKASDITESVLAINEHIVATSKYVYNQDRTNTSWKYFEYQTGALHLPDAIVHIAKIPYVLEKGLLHPLDRENLLLDTLSRQNWGMDYIDHAQEFDGETVLIGEQSKKAMFQIIDTEKQYMGAFDFSGTKDVSVYKINGTYLFATPHAAYIYYKGAKDIMRILDGVDIIKILDAKIFFKKDGNNYVIDVLRKPTQ